MIEVYRTNVTESTIAGQIVELIRRQFRNYEANFDLEDCDRILRVKSDIGFVDSWSLIDFMNRLGYQVELLGDELP